MCVNMCLIIYNYAIFYTHVNMGLQMRNHVFNHIHSHLCKHMREHICKHDCKYICKHVCKHVDGVGLYGMGWFEIIWNGLESL